MSAAGRSTAVSAVGPTGVPPVAAAGGTPTGPTSGTHVLLFAACVFPLLITPVAEFKEIALFSNFSLKDNDATIDFRVLLGELFAGS